MKQKGSLVLTRLVLISICFSLLATRGFDPSLKGLPQLVAITYAEMLRIDPDNARRLVPLARQLGLGPAVDVGMELRSILKSPPLAGLLPIKLRENASTSSGSAFQSTPHPIRFSAHSPKISNASVWIVITSAEHRQHDWAQQRGNKSAEGTCVYSLSGE